jgi:type I restriction enzyme, S subunit
MGTKAATRNGWVRVRFGEIAEQINERVDDPNAAGVDRYVGLEHLDPGSLRVTRWGSPDEVSAQKLRFHPGDIIFGKRRAYQRKVAVADFGGICSAHAMVLRERRGAMAPGFLIYFMASDVFMERAVQISVGSLSPTINWSSLRDQEFDLPPMDEQRSRCRILRTLWEAADSYATTIRIGAELRDSTIAHLYSRGTRNERRVSTPIGELPASWHVARLDERYEVQLGKMVSPKVVPDATPCLYLRNENVQWNRLDLSDMKEMGFTARERERFHLRYGDVLACEGRHVGKAAMWREEIPGACYQKALHRLRAKSDTEVPEYILHCFRYYSITKRFVVDTAETTIPHLALERLRPMLFPFPPISEQQAIAQRVSSLDASLVLAEGRLATLQRLMKTFSE